MSILLNNTEYKISCDPKNHKKIHIFNLDLTLCTGLYGIEYTVPLDGLSSYDAAPCRIILEYDGSNIIDSGYIGGESYNYDLENLGLSKVTNHNLSDTINFTKINFEPNIAKLIVETPFLSSKINIKLICSSDCDGSGSDSGTDPICPGCEDCATLCEGYADGSIPPTWSLDNCFISHEIGSIIINDGKWTPSGGCSSPSGFEWYRWASLNIPKLININGEEFNYDIGTGTWLGSAGGILSFSNAIHSCCVPCSIPSKIFSLKLGDETFGIWPRIRYRQNYNDFTITDFSTSCCSVYDSGGNYLYSTCPDEINTSGCTAGIGETVTTKTFDFVYPNTCRLPDDCPAVTTCRNEIELSSLDTTPAPCDKCYCDGGGRPIDIDIHCDGTIRPQSPEDFTPGTETFTLWFAPIGLSAIPVIDNIIYDTTTLSTTLDIVKIHTTTTASEMREWVCKYLRFVTVADYGKLKTDTENAIVSNWPYNDLYWDAKCTTYSSSHPNDIPINLVPC